MSPRSTIVLTRESVDNAPLRRRLERHGLVVAECPCIATRMIPYSGEPLADGLTLGDFDVVAFSSRRGVKGVGTQASRLVSVPLLAAVGPGTALALERLVGRVPDMVPPEGTGEAMAGLILARLSCAARVLLVRGQESTGAFQRKLSEGKNFQLTELITYENFEPDIAAVHPEGWVVILFASPSGVRRFFHSNPHLLNRSTAVAIGPTTKAALEVAGHNKIVLASGMTEDHLFQALVQESGGRTHEE